MSRRVEAAGGLVVDDAGRVAVIHRPHRQDWSLPKGHLERDEDHATAARREVAEETGLHCEIEADLGDVHYTDGRGRPKRVRYFLMRRRSGEFTPNDEADELRWIDADGTDLLTYENDVELVRAVLTERRRADGQRDR